MITLMMTGARRPITSLFAAALLGGVPTPVLAQAQETAQPATVEDAAPLPRPTGRLQIVAIPTPLPLPGQLKPLETPRRPATISNPKDRVVHANAAARVQPDRTSWLNAIQQYPYPDAALYHIYVPPGDRKSTRLNSSH